MLLAKVNDDRTLTISFSKLFEVEDKERVDTFRIIRKRAYNKLVEVIAECINYIFSKDKKDEIKETYASIKIKIVQDDEPYEFSEFLEDLRTLCKMTEKIVFKWIEEIYVEKKENKEERKNSNIELQFTSEHNKIIIRSSVMIKFIIPLIMEYSEEYFKNEGLDKYILDCFGVCFEINEKDGVDIKQKLFKIVSSRIKTTRYSDCTIWRFLSHMNETAEVASNEFYRKTLLDIIPKLSHDRNVISYIHVSIRQMLQFKFRLNYPISYTPKSSVEVIDTNNNKITNIERLEFAIARTDETLIYLNKAKIFEKIIKVFQSEDKITKDELKYYSDNVALNNIQMNFLFLFLCKDFDRYQLSYQLTYTEYMILLIYFKKWLKRNHFEFLSKWITASFESSIMDEQKIINNKEFMNSLLESKDFQYLILDKYKYVSTFLANNNVIAKKISTIFMNKPIIIPSYEEFLEGKEKEVIEDFKASDKSAIADEVLQFIKLV